MTSHVLAGHDLATLGDALGDLIDTGYHPTLGIVFSSPQFDYRALCPLLRKHGIQIFGATTAGEIANDTVHAASVVVLLLDLDPARFRIRLMETADLGTPHISAGLGAYAQDLFQNPAVLVLSAGLQTDGEQIVQGIKAGAGRDLMLYGGLAGDDFQMHESVVFSSGQETNNGLIGLIFDGDHLNIQGIATSGWQPVGIEMTITHSEGNVVYTINDEPALDVLMRYFGISETVPNQGNVIEALGVQHPLFVMRENGSSVMRAPLMSNEADRSIICAGGIKQGAKVRLGVPPTLDVVERVISETGQLRAALPSADALLLFSCIARHYALGDMIEQEIAGIHALWDAPLAGFFSYGEIGSFPGQPCEFHNETCMLVAIQEI